MKKLLFSFLATLLSTMMMAGNFVMVSYSGRAELERIFNDPNLTVHYFTNTEVFATAEHFDALSMTLLDEDAFAENEVYTLVYCPESMQGSYLIDNNIDVLIQLKDYFISRGAAKPYKNDGAVAISNKAAQLPRLTRDFPVVTEVDPRIREMLDQVNMDSLEATVQHLQDYGHRLWNSENAFAASDWIAGRMQALGLEVEQQPFYASTWMGSGNAAPNVIGIQRGTIYPDTYVVCGSHFDSFSWEAMYGSGNAPGADDNATGVASVLESARIMTQYEFEYSIIYCTYGCEEMGLYGSEAYASRCQEQGMDIIGYFNNDMNGYLYGDQIHIDCIYPNAVEPIGTYYMNIGSVYYPELPIRHVNFNEGDSDHTSFNNHGYMGIYPFEDYQNYSPYIHTTNDLIGNSVNSFAMSQQYCQMNIACLAEIANPVGEMPVIFCNPVTDFKILEPSNKEMTTVDLAWEAPEEGSTGELVQFDLYRDSVLYVTIERDVFHYQDTLSVGARVEYFVTAVYDDGCEAASETLVAIGIPDNVDEAVDGIVTIFPNPVEDQLTVKAEGLYKVLIYNMIGQKIASFDSLQGECNVTMVAYPQGLYLVKIITGRGTVNKSIVVK